MAKNKKANQKRLLALLGLLIVVAVGYFATQGTTGDLQGRLDQKLTTTKVVKPTTTNNINLGTSFDPLKVGHYNVQRTVSATSLKSGSKVVVATADGSLKAANVYSLKDKDVNALLKGTAANTLKKGEYVLVDNNSVVAVLDAQMNVTTVDSSHGQILGFFDAGSNVGFFAPSVDVAQFVNYNEIDDKHSQDVKDWKL